MNRLWLLMGLCAACLLGVAVPGSAQYLRLELVYERSEAGRETLTVRHVERVEGDFALDGLVGEVMPYYYEVYLKSDNREYLLETVSFDIPNVRIGESFDLTEGKARAEIEQLSRAAFPFRMPIYETSFLIRFYRKGAKEKSLPEKIGEWDYPPSQATGKGRQ